MNLTAVQHDHSEFVARSKDRRRQQTIIRELFQKRQMPTSTFNHLNRIINAQQRRDERLTGLTFHTGFGEAQ